MSNRLSSEELVHLSQLQKEYSDVLLNIGEITVKLQQAENNVKDLTQSREDYISTYNKMVERDREMNGYFLQKYGSITINTETGEYTLR